MERNSLEKEVHIPESVLKKEHRLSAWQAMEMLPEWEKKYLPHDVWERYYTYFCEYSDTRGPVKKDFNGKEVNLYKTLLLSFRRMRSIPGIPDDLYKTLNLKYRYSELNHVPGISSMPETAYKAAQIPCLHRSYGIKVCFEFLIRALKKKKFYESAMWMGCISHWILDVCSIGHCPMVFAWCDFFRKDWLEMKTSDGLYIPDIFLPICDIMEPVIRRKAYYGKLVRNYEPVLLADDPKEAAWLSACKAQEIQEYTFGLEERCFTAVIEGKRADREMVELAVLASKTQADIFHTAFMIAVDRRGW